MSQSFGAVFSIPIGMTSRTNLERSVRLFQEDLEPEDFFVTLLIIGMGRFRDSMPEGRKGSWRDLQPKILSEVNYYVMIKHLLLITMR